MDNVIPETHYTDINRANALIRTRSLLLGQIDAEIAFDNHPKAQNIQAQHNDLMDQIWELKKGPLSDPLETLPRELWIMILVEAVAGFHIWPMECKEIDRALELTMVSNRWRDAIITTPDLWTHITLSMDDGVSPDTLAKLATALTLSGELPLFVELSDSNPYWESILPILKPHVGRIGVIKARHFFPEIPDDHLISLGELRRLKDAPMSTTNWEYLLERAPNLTNITAYTFLQMPEGFIQRINQLKIEGCSIPERLSILIAQLASFSEIKMLTLYPSGKKLREGLHNPVLLSPLALRYFSYRQDEEFNLALNVVRLSAQLTVLDIRIGSTWQVLAEMMAVVIQLCQLEELSLRLTFPEQSFTFPPLIGSAKINRLEVAIDIEATDEHSPINVSNETTLWSYFEHHVPTPTYLCLGGRVLKGQGQKATLPVQYINSLVGLRTLRLIGYEAYPIPSLSFIEAELEVLFVRGFPDVLNSIISKIRSHQLKKMACSCNKLDKPTASYSPASFDSAYFGGLQVLHWSDGPLIENLASLSSLKKIIFSSCNKEVLSHFCIQMLLQPRTCPMLESLEVEEIYLDWDWLVLMLERRNLPNDENISPIRFLAFNQVLSPMLSRILVSLLHCKYPIRPSNRDLSSDAIADIYFDWSIPSCHNCCMTFNVCENTTRPPEPPKNYFRKQTRSHYDYFKEVTWANPDPPLPSDVAQWLEDKPSRNLRWIERSENNLVHRSWFCRKHTIGRIILTEFTLEAHADAMTLYEGLKTSHTASGSSTMD